jgi:hypothetical protein
VGWKNGDFIADLGSSTRRNRSSIRAAMLGKVPLRVFYHGEVRLLCPHMLGGNREGHVRILCLQVGGESVGGLQRKDGQGEWRCLALEKFSSVERAKAVWQSAGSSLRRPNAWIRLSWK